MPGQVRKCAVPSCVIDNKVLKKCGVTLRYFSFPKDKALKNEWLRRCSKNLDDLTKNETVCSRHFKIDDYEDGIESRILNVKPKRLKLEAIPSLFLERRHQKQLKRNSVEYHKVLAQEILNEERHEDSKSSEPPIYLEFSQCKKTTGQSKSPQSSVETDLGLLVTHNLDSHSDSDYQEGLEDFSFIEIKEEPIIKPYVDSFESHADEDFCVEDNVDDNDFIGQCYVCDKKIQQADVGNFSCEEFTKIIQKVLGDISEDYVIVMTEDDGLCGACRRLVARISKLEKELRTATIGLRALLRLKYSLPPPLSEKITTVEQPKLQVIKLSRISSSGSNDISCTGITESNDRVSQTMKSSVGYQQHKLTQSARKTPLRKNKKIQTVETPLRKKCKTEMKIVSSVNEVESLEKGDMEESTEEDDQNNAFSVQTSTYSEGNNCLFEDISNAAELTTLLNDDCLTEESVVVTENRRIDEVNLPVNRKSIKTQVNIGLLKCVWCTFKTNSTELMKTHMLSFQNKEGFYCSICNFAYHKRERYKRHIIGHSETSKNKRCIFCDANIHDEVHMRFHLETFHRENSFSHRCSICSRVFMFGPMLRRHQRHKHKMGKTYKCEKCGKTFSNDKVKYDNHVKFFHRDSLTCKYCMRSYPSVGKLISHENKHHRFETKECYQCRYCPKKFLRQDLLPLHEEHHTGQYEYRCDFCDYGLHEAEQLMKHMRYCKTLFKKDLILQESALKKYKNRLLNQRPKKFERNKFGTHKSLVCDVCGKIIKTRQKYKIHREMHDGPASYQCHLCGKKFRYKNNMSVHIKNFHMCVDEAE